MNSTPQRTQGTSQRVSALIAIPVYNEERYVCRVLSAVLAHASDVLVIDDGSTDGTVRALPKFPVDVIRHGVNRGYGRSMRDAFAWAGVHGFEWVITMDCDEQHEPASIPLFLQAAATGRHDVISGSRYLTKDASSVGSPPPDRRSINHTVTSEINQRLGASGISITDAFCGFKAYRVSAVNRLQLSEDGYAFPMQFWVQAAAAGLRVVEVPVKLIYNDPNRSFGGPLDDPQIRLWHYRRVLHDELQRCASRLPPVATRNLDTVCGAAYCSTSACEAGD